MATPMGKSASICFRATMVAGIGNRWTSTSLRTRNAGTPDHPGWPSGRTDRAYLVWVDPTVGRRAIVFSRTTGEFTWSLPVRVNDDPSMGCLEPRLAVREDSVYVAWHVVKGDRTTLYFDHSQDGGANWNSDQVIFDRKARSVQASLQPFAGGLLAGWFESQVQIAQTNQRLSYRLFSPANGWTTPKPERDSLAGDHESGRFYFGFDLLPWRGGCLVVYSKGAIGVSPEIYSGLERGSQVRIYGVQKN